MFGSRRRTVPAYAIAIGLAAGLVVWSSATPSWASAGCPTVDPATGSVTPVPAPGVVWAYCDLSGANLSGADLAAADLSDATLTQADLSGANLSGAILRAARLAGANVDEVDLGGATLASVTSGHLSGHPASLPTNWSLADGYLVGPDANLENAVLRGASLADADLSGANAYQANLSEANLSRANASGAYLDLSDLAGANLTGADFTGAGMNGVTLTRADVTGTQFSSADLSMTTTGGLSGKPASLPANFTLAHGYFLGPDVYLPNARLHGAALQGVDLYGADLEYADLSAANLSGANLSFAALEAARLSSANLSNANLVNFYGGSENSHAIFAGANLSNAYLGGNITGATFAGATLAGIHSGNLTGTPLSLPANWMIARGFLIGPGANLEYANIYSADLRGADLAGADLSHANLYTTNLTGADLADANLTQGYLAANVFIHADLSSANLTGADMTGDTVTGAVFTGVTWADTICPNGTNSDVYVAGCFSAVNSAVPVASPRISAGYAGNSGWYTSPVTVTWHWADNGTIRQSACVKSSTTSGNGSITLSATCVDTAGHKGTATYQVKVDSTAPVVTVTGIRLWHNYVLGAVPAAGCRTTENVSGIAHPARLLIKALGAYGAGQFMARCYGAVSVAGVLQPGGVLRVSYVVIYGFGGFERPRPGSTARRGHPMLVTFRLTDAAGTPITGLPAKALAAAHHIEVTLHGHAIKPVSDLCRWDSASRAFRCVVDVPTNVDTGRSATYFLTVAENFGKGFVAAPAVGSAINSEPIHFR